MITLDKISPCYPEQYVARLGNEILGYLHLRQSIFVVKWRTMLGQTLHAELYPAAGIGEFPTEEEREKQLSLAKDALMWRYEKEKMDLEHARINTN